MFFPAVLGNKEIRFHPKTETKYEIALIAPLMK